MADWMGTVPGCLHIFLLQNKPSEFMSAVPKSHVLSTPSPSLKQLN